MKMAKLFPPRFTFYALRFTLLAILLLAASLRFYRLDAQSFWNDEGNSARIAERTPALIIEGAAGDIHPPGYYLLLHYWRALFGQSEWVLRSLSVVAGMTLLLFTYLLGCRSLGKATGLTAAFLGAISPFAIYYSQEARMYTLLGALSVISSYALLRLLQKSDFSKKTWLLAYTFTCAAGLYTHYAFPFVMLVHNAIFGLWWLTEGRGFKCRWRWPALWAGTQMAIAALYLPWAPIALRSVIGWSPAGRSYELGSALLNVLRVLGVGVTLPLEESTAALVGAGMLLLAGLWPFRAASKRKENQHIWLDIANVTLYLLLPILFIFLFDLYKSEWLKFLIVALPPFHILIAHGVKNLAHVSRFTHYVSRFTFHALLPLLFITFTYPSLNNLYFDPAYARDDYRQIAADIASATRPGDIIILNAPNQWEVFTYYYRGASVYPAPYHPTHKEVEAFLEPLIEHEQQQRIFVLYWGDAESDPQRLIETWLAAHAYKSDDGWYGRVRLSTYQAALLPKEPSVALDARFGESIWLHGCALSGDKFAPGSALPVTLFWEAQAPITRRYKITIQLLDQDGQLIAQIDTEPGDGLAPTDAWEPGHTVVDHYGVPLAADLSPGNYTLIVGLYHISTGERLSVFTAGERVGDHLALFDVEITVPLTAYKLSIVKEVIKKPDQRPALALDLTGDR